MHRIAALLSAALLAWPADAATKPGSRQPSATAAAATPTLVRLPTVQMYGHAFVDLEAWARTKSLRLSWDPKTKVVGLTNRWNRLRGAASSRQLEINGVKTWLSVPITQRNTDLYVSALDLRTLLDPVLIPARNKPGQRVRVIALDAGHGGKDPGFEVGQRQEKVLNLLLAKKVKTFLEHAGLKVVLTRSSDTYVDFDRRVEIAKRARADLFVSLHYNAAGSGNTEAKGVETYCITPAGVPSTNALPEEAGATKAVLGNLQNHRSVLLAYHVHKAMVSTLSVEDRGVRRARFAVLRNAEMPAILVEGGFLSAPDEARRIVTVEHRTKLARAVTDGVLAYKRLVERR